MAELWELDFGYKIKILGGEYKFRTGFVYSDLEEEKISVKLNGSHVKEPINNLEVISAKNYLSKNKKDEVSNFDWARIELISDNPLKVLENQNYFSFKEILRAKENFGFKLNYYRHSNL